MDLARCTASLLLEVNKRAIQSGCICPHLNGFPLDDVLVDDKEVLSFILSRKQLVDRDSTFDRKVYEEVTELAKNGRFNEGKYLNSLYFLYMSFR